MTMRIYVQVRRNWTSLMHPGRYGNPPSFTVWLAQLLSWSGVLLVMKFFVGLAIYIFSAPLGIIGSLLFFPVHHHPKIELLIVMIGCPLVMNMVQFWIQDSFLKDHTNSNSTREDGIDSEEGLPLLSSKSSPAGVKKIPNRHHHNNSREPMIKLNGAIPMSNQRTSPAAHLQKKNSFTNATTAADMYEDL